jgi:serine protease AprX
MSNKKPMGGSRILRVAAALLTALAASWMPPSIAANGDPVTYVSADEAYRKLSPDLGDALAAASLPATNWIRETPDGRLLKLLVLSCDAIDPDLGPLRQAIVDAGGSVYYRFASVNGLLVMLPASKVLAIAERSDVEVISPNRPTTRTASFLEQVTGAAAVRALPAGYDGSGVGIAVLDSGVMASHKAFAGANGASRVKKSVNLRKLGSMLSALWDAGKDYGDSIDPGSSGRQFLENLIDTSSEPFQDPFGHGTVVASVAAGRAVTGRMDAGGIAPGASLIDVRVLNDNGMGEVADALAAFDWVLFHAKEYNIRVVNVSFAADSTTSYLVDPLCRAVRNTVASGVAVVVAAGNFGLDRGLRTFGTISSPGDEPSAITVGSVNPHATVTRDDDGVNMFSSRGPTRGGLADASDVRHPDNLLKPDVVAPGNAVVGALSSNNAGTTLNALVRAFPQLIEQAPAAPGTGFMQLSGSSIAAPVVAGTVALMLQANPGLTPPIVKAMLQYTAQPLPNYDLLEQGSGLVNALGAIQLAGVIVPDLATRISHGNSLKPGDSILVKGKSVPPPYSTVGGAVIPWSRFVFMGGARVLAGGDLFAKFQPVYDPTLTWVGQRVRRMEVEYFDNKSGAVEGVVEQAIDGKKDVVLVAAGVVDVSELLGVSSLLHQTGAFTPSTVVMDKVALPGSGLSAGIVLSDGVVRGDSVVLSEGVVIPESVVLSESVILSEGVIVSESVILSEGGPLQLQGGGAVYAGEP